MADSLRQEIKKGNICSGSKKLLDNGKCSVCKRTFSGNRAPTH